MNEHKNTIDRIRDFDFTKYYPFVFTIISIFIVFQYPLSTLESFFYDLRSRFDFGTSDIQEIVLVKLDEESDEFLGERYPYTYISHQRLMKRIRSDSPAIVNYFLTFDEPITDEGRRDLVLLKKEIEMAQEQNIDFRFGTVMDAWGEQRPPEELAETGHSLSILNVDNSIFARDDVARRALLDISGEDSLHLWTAKKYREKKGNSIKPANSYFGSYYSKEADATFSLFRYSVDTQLESSPIVSIPFHRVVVGNFPKGFFTNKIVLIGSEYISNSSDFIFTPFNKEEYKSSKLNVHAQIIHSLITNKTLVELPRWISIVLSFMIALYLSFVISRAQPAKSLSLTVATMFIILIFSWVLWSVFGMWLYVTHLILTVFIVYYIWVPFRAIAEYQKRYSIQEETKILKKVDHLKQNFISLMSHDLKTPVAKIAGTADILLNQHPANEEQKSHLRRIIDATKELNKFITSILDLTKIESRNLNINKESKDINNVVEEVTQSLKYEAQAKEITVQAELAPLYPIFIDTTLMRRVLSNLIENAIKYSGEGTSVQVKTHDDADWVYIEISDTGPGIARADLEHIFDKFYRVKNDANHAIKGSGLGLYLVKYFIELHEGDISVQSKLGEGTTFNIRLKNA